MVGLNGFSISFNCKDIVKIIVLKAFILETGSLLILSKIKGTAPRHLQYVYSIVSGFIANVGKLIPINDPVDMTFLTMKEIILDMIDLLSELIKTTPPLFSSLFQSSYLIYDFFL